MLVSAIHGQPSKLVDESRMVIMRGRNWSDVIKRLEEFDESPRQFIVRLVRVPTQFISCTLGVWNLTVIEVSE